MKVLYDHQIFALQKFGGISRYFNEIMKMKNEEFEVENIDPVLFDRKEIQVKQDLFSRGERFIKRKLGVYKAEVVSEFPIEVIDIFSKSNYDILHPTYYDPYFLEMNKKPFVLTVYDMIHEIYSEYFKIDDPTSRNKLLLCNKASKIIAISKKTKDDLVRVFDLPEDKVHVIPLASDFGNVVPIRPEGVANLNKYILFVGSRHAYKNFYYPMRALARILKADKDVSILCTGLKFTSDESQFFESLGIQSQMHHVFLQSDQELAWAYSNAALFIFPSLYEGFGFPMLEAFASGCPVISSTGGSLPEVGGDAAIYFDPKNIEEIQLAAQSVLYDSSVKEDLIRRGLHRYKEFSWTKCRLETAKVYESLF